MLGDTEFKIETAVAAFEITIEPSGRAINEGALGPARSFLRELRFGLSELDPRLTRLAERLQSALRSGHSSQPSRLATSVSSAAVDELHEFLERQIEIGRLLVNAGPLVFVAPAAAKAELPPQPSLPRPTALRLVEEKSFLAAQVVDGQGNPLVGRRFKLELPSGLIRKGVLEGDGSLRVNDIDPGTGRLTFLPNEGDPVDASGIPEPIAIGNRTFSMRVTTADGRGISGVELAVTSQGTTTIVSTGADGSASFEGPADPAPTAQIADSNQLRERVAQLGSGE